MTTTLTVFLGAIAGHLAGGGRHRRDEHHAGLGHRAHQEIGLRKAVGARRRDILYQFLTETIMFSVFGGIIGILVGAAISAVVSASGVMTTVVSMESVSWPLGFRRRSASSSGFIRPIGPRASNRLKRCDNE